MALPVHNPVYDIFLPYNPDERDIAARPHRLVNNLVPSDQEPLNHIIPNLPPLRHLISFDGLSDVRWQIRLSDRLPLVSPRVHKAQQVVLSGDLPEVFTDPDVTLTHPVIIPASDSKRIGPDNAHKLRISFPKLLPRHVIKHQRETGIRAISLENIRVHINRQRISDRLYPNLLIKRVLINIASNQPPPPNPTVDLELSGLGIRQLGLGAILNIHQQVFVDLRAIIARPAAS